MANNFTFGVYKPVAVRERLTDGGPLNPEALYVCKKYTDGQPWQSGGPEPGQPGFVPTALRKRQQ